MIRMRLQKYLARAGCASRRSCEVLIADGRVTVNGRVVDELGATVEAGVDEVRLDGVPVQLPDETVAIMLHKPAGYVTTMDDPQGRACVAELAPLHKHPGLFPVGRLDRDTTGLLLFTTDGELANRIMHPRHGVWKRYIAMVDGDVDAKRLAQLRSGVPVDGRMTAPAEIELLDGLDRERACEQIGADAQASGLNQRHAGKRSRRVLQASCCYVSVRIREGRNRQVRKMFAAVGCEVVALHRCELGPLSLGDLERGAWRYLTDDELAALHACFAV